MNKFVAPQPFSTQLEVWLTGKHPKNIESLLNAFGKKSFAIVIMILMFFPALPIPTGGLTHVLELVVMLLAIEMIAGRRTPWIPKKIAKRPLGSMLTGKAVPFMIKWVRRLERFSQPRLGNIINHRLSYVFVGALFFLLALAAALAPPFSGLDTLPALAAVMVSLALILDDALIFLLGVVLSVVGLVLVYLVGHTTIELIQRLI